MTTILLVGRVVATGRDAHVATQSELGYYPSGGVGLVLLVFVVLMLSGRL